MKTLGNNKQETDWVMNTLYLIESVVTFRISRSYSFFISDELSHFASVILAGLAGLAEFGSVQHVEVVVQLLSLLDMVVVLVKKDC